MSKAATLRLAAVAVLIAAIPANSSAQLTNAVDLLAADMGNYNLISLGNVTLNSVSDTGGGVAANGNLTINNNSTTLVAMTASSSGPSLYATGQLAITNGDTVQLNNGYASLQNATGWAWSSGSKQLTESGQGTLHYNSSSTLNPLLSAQNPNWNWTTLSSQFGNISSLFNGTSPTGTLSVSGGNLVVNNGGATSGVVVFNFNQASLAGLSNLAVSVPANLIYVFNVTNETSGASFLSGVNINSGTSDGQLIWNLNSVSGGNSLTLANNGKFYGDVLAPDLKITSDTDMENQDVVGSLVQNNGELDYTGDLVAVPEIPASAAWIGAACALAVAAQALWQRRRRTGRVPA